MISITWIGMAAVCFTTIAFVPQVLQILRTGDTSGISLGMYSIFTTGIALWLIYGLLLRNPPIIAANLITLALCLTVLMLIVRQRPGTKGTESSASTPVDKIGRKR